LLSKWFLLYNFIRIIIEKKAQMFEVHRDVLGKFIKHPALKDVATYHGYKGDYILKMTTRSSDLIEMIQNYCVMKSIDIVIKPNVVSGYEIYIIAQDDDVVPIKTMKQGGDRWFNN